VGNKAATFPLQTMGFNVDCINTVSLSNHPAYEKGCKGCTLEPEVFADIIEGLNANNLVKYDLILTGYTRSQQHLETMASTIKKVREVNPHAVYLCDPVLGDNGDYYVPAELTEAYRKFLLPLATIVTPNMFESQVLSGIRSIASMEDVLRACTAIHALGPDICIMTGLSLPTISEDCLTAVVSIKSIDSLRKYTADASISAEVDLSPADSSSTPIVFQVTFPKIVGHYSGCGDLFSSLTCAGFHHLRSQSISQVSVMGDMLEIIVDTMTRVMTTTALRKSRELSIIESRDLFIKVIDQFQRIAQDSNSSRDLALSQPQAYKIAGAGVLGVIFDMDGTLTEPGAINFSAMYKRTGLPSGHGDILSLIAKLSLEERQHALKIVYDEEMQGVARQVLRPSFQQLFVKMRQSKIRTALSTRNCAEAVAHFLQLAKIDRNLFLPALDRDSLNGINKPDPRVVKAILASWQVPVGREGDVWFVGDSIDDMLCAKQAGCKTVLIITTYNVHLSQTHYGLVDREIHDLSELLELFGLVH
jgi:pyridoxine kinase